MLLNSTVNPETKDGFTLAEVLITLVIIGVIAAMTIPTLMKNTQNQQFVSGLKKANSTLQQALMTMARNNDASPGDYSFLSDVDFIDELGQVAVLVKKCNTAQECFNARLQGGNVYKKLNNENTNIADGKSAILADGQLLTYYDNTVSGGIGIYGLESEDEGNVLGRIVLDVNGQKNPNVVGRDVFLFYVVNGKGVVAAGAGGVNDCSTSGQGNTCAAKVIKESAMKY